MGLRIPPLKIEIMLESNPPKSIMLVRRLAVGLPFFGVRDRERSAGSAESLHHSDGVDYVEYTCIYIYIYN